MGDTFSLIAEDIPHELESFSEYFGVMQLHKQRFIGANRWGALITPMHSYVSAQLNTDANEAHAELSTELELQSKMFQWDQNFSFLFLPKRSHQEGSREDRGICRDEKEMRDLGKTYRE